MKKTDVSKFILVDVKVTPNAYQDAIVGWKEGRLHVRIRQVPEKGKATRRLVEYLAEKLEIAPSRIEILSGEASRFKRLRIEGLTQEDLNQKLIL